MLIFKNDSLKTRCNTIIWVKKTFKNDSASCHTIFVKNRASFLARASFMTDTVLKANPDIDTTSP
jgi:hypothetical protein